MANNYMVGQAVRLSVAFKNASNVATDPTAVTVRYRNPAGTTTSKVYGTDAEVIKDSTGNYHIDVSIASGQHGEWWHRWEGTGAITAADEAAFFVRNSLFD